MVLRDPAGAPPPGEEGTGGSADAGVAPRADAPVQADAAVPVDGGSTAQPAASGGCTYAAGPPSGWLAVAVLLLSCRRRARRRV